MYSKILKQYKILRREKGKTDVYQQLVGKGHYFNYNIYLLTSSVFEYKILLVAAHEVKASRVYVKKPGPKGVTLLSKTCEHFEHLAKH